MESDLSWLSRPLQTWFAGKQLKPFPRPPGVDCHSCSGWKCCAFQPFVPNFLLGAMLEEKPLPNSEQIVYSPLGLYPTPQYRARFSQVDANARGEDLLCAFFDKEKRACSVWKNRPSECSTYFCERSGFHRNRRSDLFEWENALAQMALVEHGLSHRHIETLTSWMDQTETKSLDLHWKELELKPEDFYRSCWKWAQARSATEIYSWLSADVKARFDTWLRFA